MNLYYHSLHSGTAAPNYDKRHVFENNLFNYDLTIREMFTYLGKIYDPTNTRYGAQYIQANHLSSSKFRVVTISMNFAFDDHDEERTTLLIDEANVIVKAFRG